SLRVRASASPRRLPSRSTDAALNCSHIAHDGSSRPVFEPATGTRDPVTLPCRERQNCHYALDCFDSFVSTDDEDYDLLLRAHPWIGLCLLDIPVSHSSPLTIGPPSQSSLSPFSWCDSGFLSTSDGSRSKKTCRSSRSSASASTAAWGFPRWAACCCTRSR